MMTNSQPVRDRFASPEYCNPDAKLPFIQSLRGENPSECGFFLSLDQMAKASWLNVPKTLDSYTFSSGAVERGLIFRQPRMLVVPKSGLLAARTVKAENGNSELELLGNYRDFKGQSGVTNIQIFEVLLLDLDNYPLHEIPLQYIAKGSTQATFATHYQQFLLEITMCHAQSNGISARPKTLEFNALCVFQFEVVRELAGNGQKAFACKVASHTKPTIDNWTDFFLGRNDELADRTLQLLAIPVEPAVFAAAKPIAQIAPAIEPVVHTPAVDDSQDENIPF
ncbi:DUF5895 domain-containing protein [Chamaesiphon sp.]|uniref:DUF5895 domain-containing protein n=1 Tax=Chamaesiphon sp. TaxID=2814140 RepID=UPI003593ACAC